MNNNNGKKYEIDKSKEWFSDIIDGPGTVIDIDALITIDGKPSIFDFKQIETPGFEPRYSHPHNYPWAWRSLVRQCNVVKKLGGYLYIIIHSDYFPDQIRVLKIDDYFKDKLKPYEYYSMKEWKEKVKHLEYLNVIDSKVMTYKEFKDWVNKINKENLKTINLLDGDI